MQYIKADTNTEVLIGPVVAVGDGFTPVTTLSLSTADEAEIIKYGGATPLTVTSISANGFAAITGADGYYTLDISTSNADTEGFLTVLINDDSLCLPVRVDFMVVNANVYDSLFAAATTDYLQVDTIQVGGATEDIATETKQDVIDANVDAILVDTGTTIPGTITTLQADTDDIQTRLPAALVGGLMDSNIGAISADTTAADNMELQYDGTGLTGDTYPATQAAVGNLSTGSASIAVAAGSDTVTTGTEVNTFAVTDEVDGVYHEISDVAGVLEMYYEFDVGGNGVASTVQMLGRLNGANDSLGVYAYNWGGAAWEQIGNLDGTNSSTDSTEIYSLLTKHTGTGANLGKVRVRGYAASGLTSATLYIDQAFVSYAVVAQSVGYDGGQVWIDTVDGTAGTESYVNGVADNPTLTLADGITIASNLSLHGFYVSNESSITFAESHVNEVWRSNGGTMALGGQDISSSHFYHWNDISGTGTSASGETHLLDSHVANSVACTLGQAHITRCSIGAGGLVLSQAANYVIEDSKSGIAGASAPTIDMGAAVGGSNMSVRNWSGGITLNNLASGDVVTLEGTFGTITLNGADAQVEIRGIAKAVTNNLTGSPTVNDDSLKADDIAAILADTADMQPKLGTPAGADLSEDIADIPTVSEFEARTPTAAQLAYIVANAATGLPVTFTTSGGSTTAAVLNLVDGAAGSSTDDQYNGRLLVFTDGTLKGVVTDITDYVGSTTTATITAIPTAPTASHNARLI